MSTPQNQNSDKAMLTEEISKIQENFDEIFKASAEKTQLALGSHEDSQTIMTTAQRDKIVGYGFSNLVNVQEYEEHQSALEAAGITMEVIKILKKMKETYGKDIISYKNVVDLCKKYNLYFGDSGLFIGKMPIENVKELAEFEFDKFRSYVVTSNAGESIIEARGGYRMGTLIVAPINSFKLKDVYITPTREIIKLPGSMGKKTSPCGEDPIVLLPIKIEDELFFVVVTHWDHSKSLI